MAEVLKTVAERFVPFTISAEDFAGVNNPGNGPTLRAVVDRYYDKPTKSDYRLSAYVNCKRILANSKYLELDKSLGAPFVNSNFGGFFENSSSEDTIPKPGASFRMDGSSFDVSFNENAILDLRLEDGWVVLVDSDRVKRVIYDGRSESDFWQSPIETPWLSHMASLYKIYKKLEGETLYYRPIVTIHKTPTLNKPTATIVVSEEDIVELSYSASTVNLGALNFSVYVDRKRNMFNAMGLSTSVRDKYLDISIGDYIELDLDQPVFNTFRTVNLGVSSVSRIFIGIVSGVNFSETPNHITMQVSCIELASIADQEHFFRLRIALNTKWASSDSAGVPDFIKYSIDEYTSSAAVAKQHMLTDRQWHEQMMLREAIYTSGSARDIAAFMYKELFLTARKIGPKKLLDELALEIEPAYKNRLTFVQDVVTMEASLRDFFKVYLPPPWTENFSATYWNAEAKELEKARADFKIEDVMVSYSKTNESLVPIDELKRQARLVYRRFPMTPKLQAGLPVIRIEDVEVLSSEFTMYDILGLSTCFTIDMSAWTEFRMEFYNHPMIVIDYLAQRFGYRLKRVENKVYMYKPETADGDDFFVQALFDCVALAKHEIMQYITERATLKILYNPFIFPGMRVMWNAGKAGGNSEEAMYSGYVTTVSHSTENASLSITTLSLDFACPDYMLLKMEDIIKIQIPDKERYKGFGPNFKFENTIINFNASLFEELYRV